MLQIQLLKTLKIFCAGLLVMVASSLAISQDAGTDLDSGVVELNEEEEEEEDKIIEQKEQIKKVKEQIDQFNKEIEEIKDLLEKQSQRQ